MLNFFEIERNLRISFYLRIEVGVCDFNIDNDNNDSSSIV